ncbi:PREDICTED: probable membrane-associated kinase regulator 4 [Ipomoea nil]|uniref:probable membrane-associated kinase regulator 4 n=1 Tax=Ipomoea nil TaxID=35883 RepID=UPI000900D493|nr:PREDICTED: probable membrane-associated kinase regulator 4 [Ipomoea nil]
MQKSLLPMNIYMQKPFLPTNISRQRNFHFSGQTSNGMARNYHSLPYQVSAAEDDEYIDIEVNSFSPQSTDFEFQITSNSFNHNKELTVLPADDLFYKGKILPLLLPPRLQTVQNLLKTTPTGDQNSIVEEEDDDEFIIMEFASSTPAIEPCRLSFSLIPADHFKRSTCLSTSINKDQEKKHSWLSKLRLFKKSLMGNRGKASRVFSLRSFFRKSACIDVSSVTDKHLKAEQKKTLFGYSINREGIKDKVVIMKRSYHRRPLSSFSSAEFKWRSSSSLSSSFSSSSSSFSSISFSSRDFHELNFHKRSCSFTSDIDGPIEAAIAHCKSINNHP